MKTIREQIIATGYSVTPLDITYDDRLSLLHLGNQIIDTAVKDNQIKMLLLQNTLSTCK